jgi:hypothetical protein
MAGAVHTIFWEKTMGVAKEKRFQKLNHARFEKSYGLVFLARRAPVEPVSTPKPGKAFVRSWMRENYSFYGGPTEVAEGFCAAYPQTADWLEDPLHWIWDIAVDEEPNA